MNIMEDILWGKATGRWLGRIGGGRVVHPWRCSGQRSGFNQSDLQNNGDANVIPIVGNHEFMAITCLDFLCREITMETIAAICLNTREEFYSGG